MIGQERDSSEQQVVSVKHPAHADERRENDQGDSCDD